MSMLMNRWKRSSRPGRTSSLQGQYRRSHSRSDLRCDARSKAALSRPISADPRYGDRSDVRCGPDLPDVDRRDVRVVLEVRLSVSRLTSISSAVSAAYMLPQPCRCVDTRPSLWQRVHRIGVGSCPDQLDSASRRRHISQMFQGRASPPRPTSGQTRLLGSDCPARLPSPPELRHFEGSSGGRPHVRLSVAPVHLTGIRVKGEAVAGEVTSRSICSTSRAGALAGPAPSRWARPATGHLQGLPG
jgi:hypothetical protein